MEIGYSHSTCCCASNAFDCCVFAESAIVVNAIDGIVMDVALVRGAIFTCFFGSTGAYVVFFMAFDLRDMGDTLAVLRSTFFALAVAGFGGRVGWRILILQLLLVLL